MSQNIDLQADAVAKRGRAASIHILQPPKGKIYPFQATKSSDGQTLNLPLSQQGTNHGVVGHYQFQPSTALPSMASQAQIDIRIPAGAVPGTVRRIYLEVDLVNNSLNPAVIPYFIHSIFDRVDLLAENGSVIVNRWTNTALQTAVLYDSYSQSRHRVRMAAVDPTGIAPGATQKFFMTLPWNVFETGHLSLQGLKSDLFIRCVTRPDIDTHTSHPDVASLAQLRVHVESISWSSPIAKALASRMRQSVQNYRTWSWNEMKEVLTLAPSNSYNVRLSSVTGLISALFVWIRPSGHNLTATTNSERVDSYQLNDSSGRSIIGSSTFDRDVVSIHKDMENMLFDNVEPAVKDIVENVLYVPLAFSDRKNLESASLAGGYYVSDGFMNFAFVTNSSLVPGSYEVTFVYSRLDHVRSDGGQLSIHSS